MELSSRVAQIPIGKEDGVVLHMLELNWEILDRILGYCSVATLCAVRNVCKDLRVATDFLMSYHSPHLGVNLNAVVFEFEKAHKTQSNCLCRKCQMKAKMFYTLKLRVAERNK